MNKPPCLFGKHSKIEHVKITEAHAPSIIWTTKLAPIDLVNFLLIFGLPHQYFDNTEFMLSQIDLGSLNMPME